AMIKASLMLLKSGYKFNVNLATKLSTTLPLLGSSIHIKAQPTTWQDLTRHWLRLGYVDVDCR
ncbi:hypothetical protein WP50_22730, partial [Lactiplantibacillus plantarum]